jgi:hypothetical protein
MDYAYLAPLLMVPPPEVCAEAFVKYSISWSKVGPVGVVVSSNLTNELFIEIK